MENERPNRLYQHLAAMVALERSVEAHAAALLKGAVTHPEVVALLQQARSSSAERAGRLAARVEAVAPGTPVPDGVATAPAIEELAGGDGHGASAALLGAWALVSEGLIGYGVLLEVANRAADSIEHLGPDCTSELAWDHMKGCASLARDIARALPYVVVDELEGEGRQCRCTCPTCALGVCACPLSFRRRMDLAAADAGPIEDWPGLRVVRPRPGSPAAEAGVTGDDVVVSIAGKVVESIPMLQDAIKAHAPGETIQVEITRHDGRSETVGVVRP